MKTTIRFWAAAAIVALSACNKEKNIAPVQAAAAAKAFSLNAVSTDAFANTANPYDSVGAVHNQALGAVWDYEQKIKDTSAAGIRAQVSVFFRLRYGEDITRHISHTETRFKKDFPANADGIPKGYFSPLVNSYIGTILDAIRGINRPDDYGRFHSAVVAIESKVVLDKSLSRTEQQQVLIVASVARYSAGFWMGKVADGSTNKPVDTMGFFGRIRQAINCALADAEGAIDGIGAGDSIREAIEDASLESSLCSAFM